MKKFNGLLSGLVLGSLLWVVTGSGRAEEEKPYLPADVYKELVSREAKILADNLKGNPKEEAEARAKLAAVMIARLSLAVEGSNQAATVENAALKAAKMLGSKGNYAAIQKLAGTLAETKPDASLKLVPVDGKKYLAEVMDTMNLLRPKKKGGDGIHPDLQTSGPLKSTNGIEEKIRSLAKKKLSEKALKKSAEEMVLLGYRTAALAEIVKDFAPKAKAKDWKGFAMAMRSASIGLAQAAKKKDGDAIYSAGSKLDASCNQCHEVFRK